MRKRSVTALPGTVPLIVVSTSEPWRTFSPATGEVVAVRSVVSPLSGEKRTAGSGRPKVLGSILLVPGTSGSLA